MLYKKAKPLLIMFVLIAACAAVLTGTVLTVDKKPVAAKAVTEMFFKPGSITGVIMDSSGHCLVDVDVSARNSQGKIVARTATDKIGRYTLRNIEKGKYTIYVGNMRSCTLRVTQESKISSLTIVTPASGGGMNLNNDATSRTPSNSSRSDWQSIQLSNSYVSVGGPTGPVDPTDPEPWDENVSP